MEDFREIAPLLTSTGPLKNFRLPISFFDSFVSEFRN